MVQSLVYLFLVATINASMAQRLRLGTAPTKTPTNGTDESANSTAASEDCIRVWIQGSGWVFIDFRLNANVHNSCPHADNGDYWTAQFNQQLCIEIPRHSNLEFGRKVSKAPWYPVSGGPVNVDGSIDCSGHVLYADCVFTPRAAPAEAVNGSALEPHCKV